MQKSRKILNFLSFQKTFSHLPIVPVTEIEKAFPGFDRNALTRWQRAGYLQKIRNGFYHFAGKPVAGAGELFFIANRIYMPSYVSLQSALSWYGFIPEGVFTITSISTLKTQAIQAPLGHFTYQSIKPDLFFGYRLETFGDFRFKIADPAKALLDLLYFNPSLANAAHFHELRLNFFEIQEKFSVGDFEKYVAVFNSRLLSIRAKSLLKFLSDHDATN